ncbi:MAG: hypothetical protein DRI97_01965 [Bacteroidetes bacterium]|nr:MAG: hypothetical protein DRI83_03510 [Bacteroidota bacterium]RLD59049.1 MAG: hypothetical protein DRI97_01965 [Bacteroidota bacterium]RLD82640.1 MAG: hypothetical protein DRJ15_00925 [Bacteroidota bacterium]
MISKAYKIALFILLCLAGFSTFAQRFDIEFQQCYGGSDHEWIVDFCMLEDSSYMLLAITYSSDGDISFLHGSCDFWLVHVDKMGALIWEKTLGGSEWDDPTSISMTSNGDLLIFGDSFSNDGDVSGNHGGSDLWVVRTDISGNIIWQKCIGSSVSDFASEMIVDSLDNIYTIGYSHGIDGDITENNGLTDYWVAKLDPNGALIQQRSFGGEGYDYGHCISLTPDGGCIIGGSVQSNYGDVECDGPTYIEGDVWVVKLDSLFNIQWKKCYGGSYHESVAHIQVLENGGYLLSGNTNSNDGDVSGFHGEPGGDYHDIWVIKIDSVGNMEWQRCLGGTKQEFSTSSTVSYNDEYIISGVTSSHNGDVSGNHSANIAFDMWLVGLDNDGSLLWQQCFGSSRENSSSKTLFLSELGIFTGGSASYSDGSVDCDIFHPSPPGDADLWLFQIIDTLSVNSPKYRIEASIIIIYPNPASDIIYYYIKEKIPDPTLFVYNFYGQKAGEYKLEKHQNQIEIDVSNFISGVYLAILYSDHEIVDRRQFVVK